MSVTPPNVNQLYPRQYQLTINTWDGQTIVIGDLKWTFRIEKKIPQIYQFAEITIYNLSADTETEIFKNAKSVMVEAGYQNGPYGLIFSGPVRQPIRGKEDAVTFFLKLICIDGDDFLNLTLVNVSIASNQTFQQIANTIVRSASVPFNLVIDPNINPQQLTSRGKVVFGQPGQYLRLMAKSQNANFYIDNGVGYISALSKSPPAILPLLNAQTGMIGIPHQVDQGIEIRCLINPFLTLDSWVKLNNQDIIQEEFVFGSLPPALLDLDGVYRIIGITATGDTRGDDWYFDLTAISQVGPLPAMLSSPTQSGT